MVVSGNLTTHFLKDIPRVVFEHSESRLSPSFDFMLVGIRVYYVNEGETIENITIDHPDFVAPTHHLSWEFSITEIGYSSLKGQHLLVNLSAPIDLYNPDILTSSTDEHFDPIEIDWGTIEIQYEVSQYYIFCYSPHPASTVRPAHSINIFISMTVNDENRTFLTALEQNFQGGGPTYLARIYNHIEPGYNFHKEVSTRENELSDATDVAHLIPAGTVDWQTISLSTSSGAEQALFSFNRSHSYVYGNETIEDSAEMLYRTTGTSINTFYILSEKNSSFKGEMKQILSLTDEGFDQPIKNVLLDFLPFLVGLLVLVPSVILAYRFGRIRRESRIIDDVDASDKTEEIKPK